MACCSIFSVARLVLVLLVFLVLAGSLVLPWYQERSKVDNVVYQVHCSHYFQAFYNYTYCECSVFNRNCDTWINEHYSTGFHWWGEWSHVANQRIVYFVLWGAVAVAAVWILIQLWTSHPGISVFVLVFTLLISVSFFTLPIAARSDRPHCHDQGLCASLFGEKGNYQWNPWYGWALTWGVAPLLLLLAIVSCCEHRRRVQINDIESNVVFVTGPAWGASGSSSSSSTQSTPLNSAASSSYSAVPSISSTSINSLPSSPASSSATLHGYPGTNF